MEGEKLERREKGMGERENKFLEVKGRVPLFF